MSIITAEEAKRQTAWAKSGMYLADKEMDSVMKIIESDSKSGHSGINYKTNNLPNEVGLVVRDRLRELGYNATLKTEMLEISW